MFFLSAVEASFVHNQDALVAFLTLLLMGGLIYMLSHSKPTTQRAMLRLMFQPVLATTLLFTFWLLGSLFCLFLAFHY